MYLQNLEMWLLWVVYIIFLVLKKIVVQLKLLVGM